MVGWSFYLTDPWKQDLWIALTIFWVALLVYVRIVKPLFILRRPYLVSEVREERGDTFTLVMQPDGHPGFRFRPGQFGWLTLWGSPFKITGHPFSFSSSAAATDGRVEMSIRKLGDLTREIDRTPVGSRVYLDGPYGAFTIGNPADMHVLIAGGVGITPLMSMIRTLADRGDERPIVLLYEQGLGLDHLPRRARRARQAAQPDHRPCALRAAAGLDRRARPHQRRDFQAPSATAVRRPRIFHLRPGPDDGCDRKGAGRARRADVEVSFGTLQLRVGAAFMRRLFADRLVIATAAVVILMAILFAYERVAG
jgi:ferredoxin-NADP reductase